MLGSLDAYPLPGMLTGPSLDTTRLQGDQDHDRDINGVVRDFSYRGAYHGPEAQNPGWALAAAIKGEVPANPPTDRRRYACGRGGGG